MSRQATLTDDGVPLDASNYGDPVEDGEPPHGDVAPPCDACERREGSVEAGPLALCSRCATDVADDLAPSRAVDTRMELHSGVEDVTVRVDGEQRYHYYREGGDDVEVVVEWPRGEQA